MNRRSEAGKDWFPAAHATSSDVTIQRMYYTLCLVCGALNDWSDSLAGARRNRREHLEQHREATARVASRALLGEEAENGG